MFISFDIRTWQMDRCCYLPLTVYSFGKKIACRLNCIFALVNCLLLWFTGYQTAYSQLAFAGRKERDPFSGTIPDAKIYLAQSLQKLSSGDPGKVRCCSIH